MDTHNQFSESLNSVGQGQRAAHQRSADRHRSPLARLLAGAVANAPDPDDGDCAYERSPDDPCQVIVEANGWEAQVDETLAPLIEEIWAAGIPTDHSWHDEESVCVAFKNRNDAVKFLKIVAVYAGEVPSFYQNFTVELTCHDTRLLRHPATNQLVHFGQPRFVFRYEVIFAEAYLDEAYERMFQHNRLTTN